MESAFYVMVTGQIEACKMQGIDNVYCRYHFRYAKDWQYLNVSASEWAASSPTASL